jgi:hypothetical protein
MSYLELIAAVEAEGLMAIAPVVLRSLEIEYTLRPHDEYGERLGHEVHALVWRVRQGLEHRHGRVRGRAVEYGATIPGDGRELRLWVLAYPEDGHYLVRACLRGENLAGVTPLRIEDLEWYLGLRGPGEQAWDPFALDEDCELRRREEALIRWAYAA